MKLQLLILSHILILGNIALANPPTVEVPQPAGLPGFFVDPLETALQNEYVMRPVEVRENQDPLLGTPDKGIWGCFIDIYLNNNSDPECNIWPLLGLDSNTVDNYGSWDQADQSGSGPLRFWKVIDFVYDKDQFNQLFETTAFQDIIKFKPVLWTRQDKSGGPPPCSDLDPALIGDSSRPFYWHDRFRWHHIIVQINNRGQAGINNYSNFPHSFYPTFGSFANDGNAGSDSHRCNSKSQNWGSRPFIQAANGDRIKIWIAHVIPDTSSSSGQSRVVRAQGPLYNFDYLPLIQTTEFVCESGCPSFDLPGPYVFEEEPEPPVETEIYPSIFTRIPALLPLIIKQQQEQEE